MLYITRWEWSLSVSFKAVLCILHQKEKVICTQSMSDHSFFCPPFSVYSTSFPKQNISTWQHVKFPLCNAISQPKTVTVFFLIFDLTWICGIFILVFLLPYWFMYKQRFLIIILVLSLPWRKLMELPF